MKRYNIKMKERSTITVIPDENGWTWSIAPSSMNITTSGGHNVTVPVTTAYGNTSIHIQSSGNIFIQDPSRAVMIENISTYIAGIDQYYPSSNPKFYATTNGLPNSL